MSWAINFFSNPWVIGIGTAIVGGIGTFIISAKLGRFVWFKKDSKEYRQQVEAANQEILYALRPSIAESIVPQPTIIEALIAATARKYDLQAKDLYSSDEFADELIKEVMDSSFISTKQKISYCEAIAEIKQPDRTEPVTIRNTVTMSSSTPSYYRYRQELLRQTTFYIALVSAVFTGLGAYITTKEGLGNGSWLDASSPIILVTVAVSTAGVGLVIPYFIKSSQKLARKDSDDNFPDDDNRNRKQ